MGVICKICGGGIAGMMLYKRIAGDTTDIECVCRAVFCPKCGRRLKEKKGKWIDVGGKPFGAFECSRCGYTQEHCKWSYCPTCGADMRGGEQDG